MSDVLKIKRGLDIRLVGKAEKEFSQVALPEHFAIKPSDFQGLTPKMVAKPGDKVKAGTVLFVDKYRPEIKFVSPVSGELKAVNRGERRVILEVVVESDHKMEHEDFGKSNVKSMNRAAVVEKLLASGAWVYLKQRPYNILANPAVTPRAIFVSTFDSAPLAPDYDFVVKGQEAMFQAGLDVLKALTPKVYLGVHEQSMLKAFTNAANVEVHTFSGKHPVGNVGVQIHHVAPINAGEAVWTIQPQEIVSIGKLFSEGIHDFSRIVALTGSEVGKTGYVKTYLGASVSTMLKQNVESDNVRVISGNVLTGSEIDKDGYLGYYHSQVTVIPEGNHYEFMGWATPGFGKFSVSRSFFSWMCNKKEYKLDTNMHGAHRAFVVSDELDKVLPMDIYSEYLFKAILAQDIDKMEQLGIYELVEEDVALCEFVCTSKLDLQVMLRNGLNLMMKEVG